MGRDKAARKGCRQGRWATLLSHTGKRLPGEPLLPLHAVGHRLEALRTPTAHPGRL